MLPPPSSHVPPPFPGQNMYQPQDPNQLNQQMHNLKLGPQQHQNPMMPNKPMFNNNQQPDLATGVRPQYPTPEQRMQMMTTVTYSGHPRATYPYNNGVPAGQIAQQPVSMNNNPPPMSNVQNPMQPMNQQGQKLYQSHNSNFNSGMSNGHEAAPMPYSSQYAPPVSQLSNQGPPQSRMSAPPSVSHQQSNMYSPQMNQNAGPVNSMSQPFAPMVQPVQRQPVHSQMPNSMQVPPRAQPPSSFPQGSSSYPGMVPGQPNAGPPPMGMQNQPNQMQNPASMGNSWQQPQYQGMGPPPPPGPGVGQPQPARMLDLDQMPSTVQVREEDRNLRNGYYQTDVRAQSPPLVTTNFIAQDRGMCNPRFIRSSLYCLPNNPDILKQTALPFAITISPLARLTEGETEPPVCAYRDQGPLRCKRCKAYMCPFMTFMEGGRCFQCAFCKVVTEVPQEYFCFLDNIGERTDKYHRPELCLGSYEFMATKEYCRNDELPNPPAYIFMIEVSNATFRNGLVPLLCENMKNILKALQNDEKNDTSKLRVGFVTYNNVLHFYNMKKNLTHPHIMVLSDVHNAFVPLLEGFLVTLSEAEYLVDCLMDHIPQLFANEPATEIILGPVIQVGLEALKNANCSGKLFVFHSTIPNAEAPGKLQHRDGQKLLGTDKQKTALSPQHDFYSKLAQECVAAGCAVDLYLFPNAFIDIASINPLCRHTGGQIYKYTYFQSHIDGDRFLEDLERNLTTTIAFDAVLRLRSSAGISPVFYYGNFYMSNATDIELSAIDCHKAVTIELAYDDKLAENETVYLQSALLYTSCTGERRIRVHNLAIATSVNMPDIYRCCEMDALINFLAKQALKQVLDQTPHQLKNALLSRSVKSLACYRKNCAASSSSGQLILPDSLKLLPLYLNCVLKSDAVGGGSDISVDDRSFAMLAVNSMDVKSTATYFYPNLIPLHEIDPNSDSFPSPIRCSIEKLNDNGAYLLENGIMMLLWIGQGIDQRWLQNVLGVQNTSLIDKQRTSLPELDNPLSNKIRQMIEEIEDGRQWFMRLTVMVQGDKLEIVFRHFLVEDRGSDGSPSYVEFLCHLHREISKIYKDGS